MTDEDWKVLNDGNNNMLLGSYMDASKLETSKETYILACPNVWSVCDYGTGET